MSYSEDRLKQIWNKGKKIRGKDSQLYRRDNMGNEMYWHSYGLDSEKGWSVDHSKPKKKGGSDHLNNLQPMNTSANKSKGANY